MHFLPNVINRSVIIDEKTLYLNHLDIKNFLNTIIMAEQKYPCETCKFRAHYDKDPKSFLGRFWRWHINFCPGWKGYFTHQDEETKAALREKYNFKKYQ